MRQLQVTKVSRTATQRRRAALLTEQPLDPRDPDILRAKQLARESDQATTRDDPSL
ncbi:hypothetical protein EV646_11983 [Kribbella antiqua]|uniref:Uncharacterized protein n=1 Tax=Kribbella antiqua TaxID=2512217 RepID=A0A4R2I4C5_9ACTN|nr:hypothetical protein [Kribbella antiqua]TCO39041.1 hypothetical protein EV646_11983 [Kribbella antiqua]